MAYPPYDLKLIIIQTKSEVEKSISVVFHDK